MYCHIVIVWWHARWMKTFLQYSANRAYFCLNSIYPIIQRNRPRTIRSAKRVESFFNDVTEGYRYQYICFHLRKYVENTVGCIRNKVKNKMKISYYVQGLITINHIFHKCKVLSSMAQIRGKRCGVRIFEFFVVFYLSQTEWWWSIYNT